MFEQSVLVERKRRRVGQALAVAVMAHVFGFGAVLAAGVWTVPAVEAPMLAEVYVDFLPQPPAASPRAPEPEAAAPQPPAEPPPVEPPVTQPEDIPDETPTEAPPQVATLPTTGPLTPLAPGGSSGTSSTEGVPWGDPNAPPGGGGGNGDTPVELTAQMVPPAVIHRVTPLYTEQARRARIQGIVIVEATIDRTGHVMSVKVIKPLPLGLDASAVTAVRQWRFTPATLQGRPVPVYFRLTVHFNIQ